MTTRRAIGPLGATAIVAGSMLGVGIFLTPSLVAKSVSSPTLFLLLWVLGGVIAIAGAVTYAELGAMMPEAGGDYVYLDRAFGSSLSFAAGTLLFIGVFGGSIASMSAAVSQYQFSLLASTVGFDLSRTWLTLPGLNAEFTGVELVAMILVLALTGLNAVGVRLTSFTQSLLTAIPVGVLVIFAIFAFATAPHATAVPAEAATPGASSIGAAVLNIYFAYAGWNAVAYVGGEVRNPGRNIPLGLLLGTAIVTGLYLLLCAAWISVLGMGGLASVFEAGTAAAKALLGPQVEVLVAAIIAVALVGSVNATVLGGARIGYAMGRDGAFLRSLGRLSARTEVPTRALWAQAFFALFLIATGTFERLVLLTSVAMFLLGCLTVCALFALRKSEPDADRPYRASWYPVLPLLYLVTGAAIILVAIKDFWQQVDLQTGFPLLGLGVFVVVWIVHSFASRRE